MESIFEKSVLDSLQKEFKTLSRQIDKRFNELLIYIKKNTPKSFQIEVDCDDDILTLERSGNDFYFQFADGPFTHADYLTTEEKLTLIVELNESLPELLKEEFGETTK